MHATFSEIWTWHAFLFPYVSCIPPSSYLLGSSPSTARKTVSFSVQKPDSWYPTADLPQSQWHKITFMLRRCIQQFVPHFCFQPSHCNPFFPVTCFSKLTMTLPGTEWCICYGFILHNYFLFDQTCRKEQAVHGNCEYHDAWLQSREAIVPGNKMSKLLNYILVQYHEVSSLAGISSAN